MSRMWIVAPAAILVLLLGSPAQAKGGGGLELDEQVERNELVSVDEVLFARDKSMAKEYLAGGPFHAYLSAHMVGRKLRQPPPLPNGARYLGPIVVRGYEKVGKWWSVRFGVDFTIPSVPLGTYRIDVCTDPCKHTIEELYPTVTRVVSGPLEERLEESFSASLDASAGGFLKRMYSTDKRGERRVNRALNGLRDYTRVRLDRQGERIDELTVALQATRRAATDKPFPITAAALAFGVGALLASAGWFSGFRLARAASPRQKKASALGRAT